VETQIRDQLGTVLPSAVQKTADVQRTELTASTSQRHCLVCNVGRLPSIVFAAEQSEALAQKNAIPESDQSPLSLPVIPDLRPQDRRFLWSVNADLYLVALDFQHMNQDVAINPDSFTLSTSQHKHCNSFR
jgi:hypothetical protein